MAFNSIAFLFFFFFFFLCWPFAKRTNNRKWIYLTATSLFFYAWWDWRFLFLFMGGGLVDYFSARCLGSDPRHKNIYLAVSILGRLGSLFTFKYAGFIAESIDRLSLLAGFSLGLKSHLPAFTLLLPIGISFYTFQSLSYTIGVYRGEMKPVKNIFHFFAFLSLFPQLLAGPIVRAKHLIPQLAQDRPTTEEDRWAGTKLIAGGYFKKLVLADNLAPLVNAAFAAIPAPVSSLYWWLVMAAFAFQIYFDFSGYTDIARGIARLMGYDYLLNFNHPYRSQSLREFWTRWHISLSTWFRDYVYIPLGGSKKGEAQGHFNMWLTMLASGLWHGAALHFVAWGGLHALLLSVERVSKWPERLRRLPLGRGMANAVIIFQVLIAWVFFRSSDLYQAGHIIGAMLSFNGFGFEINDTLLLASACIVIGSIYELFDFHEVTQNILSPQFYRFAEVSSVAILIACCIYLRGQGTQFIYFQF